MRLLDKLRTVFFPFMLSYLTGLSNYIVMLNRILSITILYFNILYWLEEKGTNTSDNGECNSNKFVFQKLDYMHKNPVSNKWQLVNDYTNHLYSSVSYYEKGIRQ